MRFFQFHNEKWEKLKTFLIKVIAGGKSIVWACEKGWHFCEHRYSRYIHDEIIRYLCSIEAKERFKKAIHDHPRMLRLLNQNNYQTNFPWEGIGNWIYFCFWETPCTSDIALPCFLLSVKSNVIIEREITRKRRKWKPHEELSLLSFKHPWIFSDFVHNMWNFVTRYVVWMMRKLQLKVGMLKSTCSCQSTFPTSSFFHENSYL